MIVVVCLWCIEFDCFFVLVGFNISFVSDKNCLLDVVCGLSYVKFNLLFVILGCFVFWVSVVVIGVVLVIIKFGVLKFLVLWFFILMLKVMFLLLDMVFYKFFK